MKTTNAKAQKRPVGRARMPRKLFTGSGTERLWNYLVESAVDDVYEGSQRDMASALDYTLNKISKSILLLRRYGMVESLTGRNCGRWGKRPRWEITQQVESRSK